MYKTIRHGENSLQYMILPQNDDFRIEGKLSAASSSCGGGGGGNGRKRNEAAPRRRRSFFAYLGLIFVCTVIIGAVLVPFLVSAECLPNPTEWFLKTKAAFTSYSVTGGSGGGGSEKRQQQQQQHPQHITNVGSSMVKDQSAGIIVDTSIPIPAALGQSVQIVNRNGVEQFVLKLNKSRQLDRQVDQPQPQHTTLPPPPPPPPSTPPPAGAAVAAAAAAASELSLASTSIRTTTTSTTTTTTIPTVAATLPPNNSSTNVGVGVDVGVDVVGNGDGYGDSTTPMPPLLSQLPSTVSPPLSNKPPGTTITTRIIQVPLLKAAAKKPIMPPVLAKTQNSLIQVAAKNKSNDWMTHWPYIDPSTYFPWTEQDQEAEDSVLLPALLGFALIGMILIITVCLVARNKRTIVSSVRKRNRNDIEEQGTEDNATLLAAANLSDED